MPLVHMVNGWNAVAGDRALDLNLVTFGAQAVVPGEGIAALHTSPWWGLGYLFSNEGSNVRHRLIDLDDNNSVEVSALVNEVLHEDWIDACAYRKGQRFVQKLKPGQCRRKR